MKMNDIVWFIIEILLDIICMAIFVLCLWRGISGLAESTHTAAQNASAALEDYVDTHR